MRIVKTSAPATADRNSRAGEPRPMPVAPTPGTGLVAMQPMRRSNPIAQHVAGPDAGFVMQLIATAQPPNGTAFDQRTVYAAGTTATAAYRATAQFGGDRRGNDRSHGNRIATSRSA